MTGVGVPRGERDVQTVTADGVAVVKTIDGVMTRSPKTHVDFRGELFEMYTGPDEFFPEPVVWVYHDIVYPGQIKGWARHEVKIDRYTLVAGSLTMLLWDGREGSPTFGVLQPIQFSMSSTRQVRIPVGVWHLIFAQGSEPAYFVNMPTEAYHHHEPDRVLLPWDSAEIPVDVRQYLPKF
ncbi:MAG: dTDP-4-dehydrorhamnose 3,5-epimerase [Demequinaceae bacterium]|nr:dTDP-4-dehydrorhamnose 3,5-epimerase [Demequinaceae bacterium]